MKLNFTSGLVLLLISIFVTPVAMLSYRALTSSTEPTAQIRMLDSPPTRIETDSTGGPSSGYNVRRRGFRGSSSVGTC